MSRVIACVAGMHRSGTSLVAQLLHRCGLWLGPDDALMPPTEGNADGYFEHLGFVRLNDAILEALGGSWEQPPPSHDWTAPRIAELRSQAQVLAKEFDGSGHWGWKDPRNSLTHPFWLELFPYLRTILCVRNPADVARSLQRREGTPFDEGVSLWSTYNQRLLISAPADSLLVVEYQALLEQPLHQLSRILSFLGIDAGRDVVEAAAAAVKADLRHHDTPASQLAGAGIGREIQRQYFDLCELAGDGERPDALALDAARARIDELEREVRYWRGRAEGRAEVHDEIHALRRMLYSTVYDLKQVAGPVDAGADGAVLRRLHRRVRDAVEACVPADASVAVISGGDGELLDLWGRPASHFPCLPSGEHTGHHPAAGLTAVAHLEAQRFEGRKFFVVPAPYLYWLDHYRELTDHLSSFERVHDDPASGVIFDLRRRRRSETPAGDRSVAIATAWPGDAPGLRRWVRRLAEVTPAAVSVSLVVATAAKGDVLSEWPGPGEARPDDDSVAHGLRVAAGRTSSDVVVLVEPGVLPLEGWWAPLLEALDEPGCLAAGARVLDATGALAEAGGDILPDGTLAFPGQGDLDVEHARYTARRDVAWCSTRLLAVDGRALRSIDGVPWGYGTTAGAAAALCAALTAAGGRVRFVPGAVAVDTRGARYELDDGTDTARLRTALASAQR